MSANADNSVESKKRWGLGCAAAICIILLVAMCSKPSVDTEGGTRAVASAAGSGTKDASGIEGQSKWRSHSTRDEVRGGMVHFAELTSTNSVDFDFPYAGGSTLRLVIRKHPEWGNDVFVEISDGQFVCGIYDCKGTINYGKGSQSLSLATPEDHDSRTLFFKNAGKAIEQIKTSKRIVIELPFFQEGNRQFMFESDGLVWPPPKEDQQ